MFIIPKGWVQIVTERKEKRAKHYITDHFKHKREWGRRCKNRQLKVGGSGRSSNSELKVRVIDILNKHA